MSNVERASSPPSKATRSAVTLVCLTVIALSAVAAGAGLLVAGGPGGYTFTSIHGQAVEMYGRGLYQYDSLLIGSGFRGADAVVLVVGLPLLAIALVAYRRGSLRGHLLLTGTLAFFLYQYASMAFGAAFNPLFAVYIALFGLSLIGFAIAFGSVDLDLLARSMSPHVPVRAIAAFLFVVSAVLLLIWGGELAGNLAADRLSARMDNYTSVVTDVLDLGVVVPAALIGAVLILRRAALGYLLASTVLVVSILMGPLLIALSISQMAAGVSFTTGEFVGPVMGFTIVALVGTAIAIVLLRAVEDGKPRTGGAAKVEAVATS